MRIAELVAWQVRIPLKKRIRHASFSRDENETFLVKCVLDDGTAGWGEGLPRPYVTGETIDSAWLQWSETDFRRQLGDSIGTLRDAMRLCGRLRMAAPPGGVPDAFRERGCFGNTVRCAVEIAVLDAVARVEGVPLSSVTALAPETAGIRDRRETVRYSAVLTAETPFRRWLSAWKYRLYGFQQVKAKVGMAGADDQETLRAIRGILKPTVELRLDANEAWTCETLEAKVAPLREFRIASLEQPVPVSETDRLAAVRGRLGVPILLDESLCSEWDAQRAIERDLCDAFNLRLSKCGGFLSCLRLAAMAHRAGLTSQLGCQVGETGILSAAGRHFAASVSGLTALEGSYDRHLVRERLTREDITFGYGGSAPALTGPGLGISVDERAVKRTHRRVDHKRFLA